MLAWTIVFLILSIIAAFLGFATIIGTTAEIAKVLFGIFLVLFLVSLYYWRGGMTPPSEFKR